jgi:hypothetical protein
VTAARIEGHELKRTPVPLLPLRIFVASPGDLAREREHVVAVVSELNQTTAHDAGFALQVVRWETHARPDLGRPQQVIFDQIGAIDIFVGLMWQRFGTPTGVAESGTEEEFNAALDAWQRERWPRVMYYFSRVPIEPPSTIAAAEQLVKVARFRERLNGLGLVWSYASEEEFRDVFRRHLQDVLRRELAGRVPPLAPELVALLDVERDACQRDDVAFQTPHLLLAMLREAGTRTVFHDVFPDTFPAFFDRLRRYAAGGNDQPNAPYAPVDWYARKDVQAARMHAVFEGARHITLRHMLLGFLDTSGNTRAAMSAALGDGGLAILRERLARNPSRGTPGVDALMGRTAPTLAMEGADVRRG